MNCHAVNTMMAIISVAFVYLCVSQLGEIL